MHDCVNLLTLFFLLNIFLQNEIATSSCLLSRSLQIAHDIPVPELIRTSNLNYWHLDDQSPTLPNSQFLGMPPPPYDMSTSQLYTSPSSQPTLHNSMYNSTFHSDWDECYGTYTIAGQTSVSSTVVTTCQSPPAYPYTFPATSSQTIYSHGSVGYESPISSPESIHSSIDNNFGSQSLVLPTFPLIDHDCMNDISSTAPPTVMMNFEMPSSYPTPVRMMDNHTIQLNTKPLKKGIRMPQSKHLQSCI